MVDMMWFFIATLAQVFLGTAAVIDKRLLRGKSSNSVIYTFWLGILSICALVLIPFAPALGIPLYVAARALIAGAIFILGLYALFTALDQAEASAVLPLIGVLLPISTLLLSISFLAAKLGGMDIIGFFILVAGALVFFIAEKKEFRRETIAYLFVAAILLGCSSVLSKQVFDSVGFIGGFIWIKMGEALCAISFLAVASLRKEIRASWGRVQRASGVLYLSNRVLAAAGSVLMNFAISLSHPALVESAYGLRFVVIFAASWLILRERFAAKHFWGKMIAALLVIIGLLWIGLTSYARSIPVDADRNIAWGVTFSSKFSRQLGLDPTRVLDGIINGLHPSSLRLVAYWDEIEKIKGEYDFSSIDWQIARAREAGVPVILAMGFRVPRWPECHMPEWAASLSTESREEGLRAYVREATLHYRDEHIIRIWQVENEPFLKFGLCPERGDDFLAKEIAVVRSVDSSRNILVTDGGEFGDWYRAVNAGDIFGTTMYRKVYPPSIGHIVGIIEYPIGTSFFRLKEKIIRAITGKHDSPFVVIELQGEPWGKYELPKLTFEEHLAIFPVSYFRTIIEYARETGFKEYYLWGAEWWYFAREHGHGEYWEEAKKLFTEQSF